MGNTLSILLVLCVLQSPVLAAEKVRIAVANLNVSFLPAGVALQKGFFKEEGLEAEVISMRPPVSITALSSGDIDYTMVFGSVVRAAMRGLPVKVIASFIDGSTHALIARPEFKSVKELKGRILGIGSYGATDDVAGRMMLKHFGVDPEREIKVVALGADRARFAALKEGIVDVAVIAPPADSEGKKLGFTILARAYELFSFPFVGLGASVRKIKERPNEAKGVIKALIRANRFIRENREEAIQILARWGRTEPGYAAASYDSTWKVFNVNGSIPEDGLQTVIEQAKKDLKINRDVSLSEVSDLSVLREAQRELGIKGR